MNEQNEIKDFGTRNTGMKVPDNYFDDFTARMNSLIDEEESLAPVVNIDDEANKPGIIVKLKPFIYMAAMYIALFLFFKAFIKDSSPQDNISNNEIYSDEQALIEDAMYASINEYDLMEYLYANAN